MRLHELQQIRLVFLGAIRNFEYRHANSSQYSAKSAV
jgi:hypothetical protein